MTIIHKIKELGGFAYSSEKDGQFEFTESMIDGVEKTLGTLPEKGVLVFVNQYGFCYFIDLSKLIVYPNRYQSVFSHYATVYPEIYFYIPWKKSPLGKSTIGIMKVILAMTYSWLLRILLHLSMAYSKSYRNRLKKVKYGGHSLALRCWN